MAIKDFNFKQFMLKRGEWVGLTVAVLIALPLLISGFGKLISSPSPEKNEKDLKDLASGVETKIQQSVVPADAGEAPPELATVMKFEPLAFVDYLTPMPWWVTGTMEDTKRRAPDVLTPADFRAVVVRGAEKGLMIRFPADGSKPRIMGVRVKDVEMSAKVKKYLERIMKQREAINALQGGMNGMGGMRGGMMGGPGGGMGGGPVGPKMGGGMAGGGIGGGGMPGGGLPGGGMQGRGMMGGGGINPMMLMQRGGMGGLTPGGNNPNRVKEFVAVDLDQIGKDQKVRPAEDLYPVRMVMVSGTFPFKDQLNNFRQALRRRDLNDLYGMFSRNEAEWKFLGLEIERRVLNPDGSERSGWEPYTKAIADSLRTYMRLVEEPMPEDENIAKYEGILNPGLYIPRLPLVKGEYPRENLKGIEESMAALDKIGREHVQIPKTALEEKIGAKEFNPFNPRDQFNSDTPADAKKEEDKPTEDKKKPATDESEPAVPDKALVRFLDPTVEPGQTYEYRVRVKMANPNYKHVKSVAYQSLAKNPEIVADKWSEPIRVFVPYDIQWYAVDEHPSPEQMHVQLHRWIDQIEPNPESPMVDGVGDWVILEKQNALAHRGEYLGRVADVEVPIWDALKESYELVMNPKNKTRKVPVDFTVRHARNQEAALVVDYEGGKIPQQRFGTTAIPAVEVPTRILVLTPEGKLEMRSSADDLKDSERTDRYNAWKQEISDVKTNRKTDRAPAGNNGMFDNRALPKR